YSRLNKSSDVDIDELIANLKKQGKHKQIDAELKKLKNIKRTSVPKDLAYCEGELFEQYIHDMKIVQRFAVLNRKAMMDEIVKGMNLHVEDQFTTIHNYRDTEAMILRKGAVSAKEGEILIIPINMRDGSLICTGKGNPDWNFSAPHGAGRLMSRSKAKDTFTISEFRKEMEGIYTTSVNEQTIDECPMVYKPMEDIVNNIGDTVEINEIIKPIYNFKAGAE
ncbi:RtcB family protein, partial [bacterium]|nr:RtcB family protein [bacterium]